MNRTPALASYEFVIKFSTSDRNVSRVEPQGLLIIDARACKKKPERPVRASGRLKIAQRFIAGNSSECGRPTEKEQLNKGEHFSRPLHGLHILFARHPSSELLGYYQSSVGAD
jgi:hypothetical protein